MSRAAGPSFAEAIRTASEMAPSYLEAMALLHLRARLPRGPVREGP